MCGFRSRSSLKTCVCAGRNEVPRSTREKTSGTQGRFRYIELLFHIIYYNWICYTKGYFLLFVDIFKVTTVYHIIFCVEMVVILSC